MNQDFVHVMVLSSSETGWAAAVREGEGGGPGIPSPQMGERRGSEAVDQHQFGIVERFDIDAVDVADRDAVAGGGVFAVDAAAALRARQSVVSGKSVSVRLDLGGRRILKNKKRKKN